MTQSEDPDPSADPTLDALKKKIDAMASERQEKEPTPSDASSAHKAMHVATEFLVTIGVGGGLGYWLDIWLETSPILFVVCFFLGFAAAVKNMLRNLDTL